MKMPSDTTNSDRASRTAGPSHVAIPLEDYIGQMGERLFLLMEQLEAPSLFSHKGLYGALMGWAMRDEQFKTQLFRFVDVLPSLTSSAEVARHLKEYLDNDELRLSAALRVAIKASEFARGLLSGGIRSQVTNMARQFMLGNDEREILRVLRRLHDKDVAFTIDVLGEAVVSEAEADRYAHRYLELLSLLARETASWPEPCRSNLTPRGAVPALNLSIKISALYSQIHPADPETAVQEIARRLRPILRLAQQVGAFINFDMETYALKDLTLRLFKTVFAEAEFAGTPECGIALQAYLRETEADLRDLAAWARRQHRRFTVRLVKGAYWDYETLIARQHGWPVPVFSHKAETDLNFEQLSLFLLEQEDAVGVALGTHNVRSIAYGLAQADRLGMPRRNIEFQMLHGMADTLKSAVLQTDCRVREYCPVGELLPGMAYLVRRLLENTSNEGFLANQFVHGASREELMRNPREILARTGRSAPVRDTKTSADPDDALSSVRQDGESASPFRNEPLADFTRAEEREKVRQAITRLRRELGAKHPLVIDGQPVETAEWTRSLNPADQQEVIGHVAHATVAEAEAALAAAHAAQPKWGRRPAEERAELIENVARLMRRDKAALTALEILEAGKSWAEADADVVEAIDYCNFYAAEMRALSRPRRTQAVAGESNFQHWLPRGVGVIIAPWNFPLAILAGMATAALVTGNAVLLKPSEQTPVLGARLMTLLMEAGFPPGVANLVTGPGADIGAHLVAHPQIEFIAFTGSMEVGLRIWEAAGRTPPGQAHLKKVICEMGGKNALIVDGDADLDEAVTGVLASAFGYQGQKCSALSRLIVLADNYDKFLERLIAATASLRVGPAEFPGNTIGPVIDRAAQQKILDLIKAGKTEATLAWQGEVPDNPNACYVPPAIFTDVEPGCRIFREEIFGPVLAVSKAKDFEEALMLANDSQFALTGGLYSRSPAHIERAKAEMVCGNLYINRTITGAVVGRQPFGGFKMSGGGTKAGGREYLHNFLLPRVVTENCLRRGFAPVDEAEGGA